MLSLQLLLLLLPHLRLQLHPIHLGAMNQRSKLIRVQ
jgi:hypothetical protein